MSNKTASGAWVNCSVSKMARKNLNQLKLNIDSVQTVTLTRLLEGDPETVRQFLDIVKYPLDSEK